MLLLSYAWLVLAHLSLITDAADTKCVQGIQALLQPLKDYPPAQKFCTAKYPPKHVRNNNQRSAAPTPTVSLNSLAATTKSLDPKESLFSAFLSEANAVASTFCSCLTSPPQTTTKSTSKVRTTLTTTFKPTPSTKSSTKPPTTTSSSPPPVRTACSAAQSDFCTSQKQNTCLCQLDTDGVTPVCSNGAICPQSTFPNPPSPCGSDADCALYYPGSTYTRCVYTDKTFFCSPTFCATEDGCNQQRGLRRKRSDDGLSNELADVK